MRDPALVKIHNGQFRLAGISLICFSFLLFACSKSPQLNPKNNSSTPLIATGTSGLHLQSETDRTNFRRWFTAIAEMQFYQCSAAWNVDQRDCAGCIRFAMREAMRPHDATWFRKMGDGYEPWAPDVRSIYINDTPLREKIFRTTALTSETATPNENNFSEFADAKTLLQYNCTFISRDRKCALPGDLLFFHQPQSKHFPFHAMIFLGAALRDGNGAHDWVVYHTGASPDDSGTVKKVRLAILDQHPAKRWRPVPENKNFLGFYRLKILE